ncbi:hypothetical protein JTE90_014182 [Oedothorax gibbosus]|uniref:Uncharacterized protein n=1 Tax=Oedothorax gibbosus TaxID=931172 RepID=A0AAV6VKP6_9ARAC|nr:hypothetical protein JTE90_014182 [Oedothorax gibbosus]
MASDQAAAVAGPSNIESGANPSSMASDQAAAGPSNLPAEDPIDYALPPVFHLKSHASPRTEGETVEYPARIRTGDLPHYCYFPGLKVSSRAVVRDVRGGYNYVSVHYRHCKWGVKPAGRAHSEKVLRQLYSNRYSPPYPQFSLNFDPNLCFCK